MKNETMIDIARDFSPVPAGRFYEDGPFSGQAFRERVLMPLMGAEHLTIVLDGVRGLPASFLEEAFGGLVRKHGFNQATLTSKLSFVASTARMQRYPSLIWGYIAGAGVDKSAI